MESVAVQNPYEASIRTTSPPSDALSWPTYLRRIFWFVPGTIIGRELERCMNSGVARSISRYESMTTQGAIALLVFACCCLFLTILWRLPRRCLVKKTRMNSLASFLSGILMMLLAGLIIRAWFMTTFLTQAATIFLTGIVAVECESILSRLLIGQRHFCA